MIDFEPTEEQQMIVDTVRQFAENELRPRAREADDAGSLPDDVLEMAHELGLVALALPEEHGGGGQRSALTGALVAEELAFGDLSLALGILSPALGALPVLDFGTAEQQARTLSAYTEDRFRPGSLALLEPRFDCDPWAPAALAKADGEGFVLEGRKCLVPWLPGTDSVLVSAALEGTPQLFCVPAAAENLVATPEANMGISGLPTVELELSGVRVAGDARIGGETGVDLSALIGRGRVALAALAVGVARAAYEVARDYAKERHAFGVPIATKQAIAFKLADMALEIDGARLLCWEAAWRLDSRLPAEREAALAKQQSQQVALRCADDAVQVFGGHGYIREYMPEMYLRNARGFAAFEALALV